MTKPRPTAPSKRDLCVDGHEFKCEPDNEPNWIGDGKFPPFAIFDIDAQRNLLPYYATRAQAEAIMASILATDEGPL